MTEFEAEAVRLGLKTLFEKDWFDVCRLKECLDVAGVAPPRRDLRALQPLHCVHYSEMTPEMRERVFEHTMGLFKHASLDLSALDRPLIGDAPDPPGEIGNGDGRGSFLRRLIGAGDGAEP